MGFTGMESNYFPVTFFLVCNWFGEEWCVEGRDKETSPS